MASERFGIWVVVACLAARTSPLLAQEQPVSVAPASKDQPNTHDTERAVVVLVGLAASDAELRALLRELLESRGVVAELTGRPRFVKDDLLREAAHDGAVHVFVVPGAEGNVGLYFRHPDGERFLLRSILLRGGFDDVGREQIGQVVETAVASLLHSSDGLTREQTQLALATEASPTAAEPAIAAEPAPAAAKPPPSRVPEPRSPPPSATLEGWLGLHYGAAFMGDALGAAHGPGLELGVGARHVWVLRGRLTGERDFTQTLTSSQIRADVDTLRWRVALDAGLMLARSQALLVSLGAGQDRSTVEPKTAPGSAVMPGPQFQDTVPVVHAELRYEVGRGSVRASGALGLDAALVETHFDVSRSAGPEPVVRPWLVRPTVSLGLAFCPRLARF